MGSGPSFFLHLCAMHPRSLRIEDYTYELPDDRIAHHPLPARDAAKLLVYKDGEIRESIFKNIAAELPADALIVFNQTKVVHARLLFQKDTGGKIEVFCLGPDARYADITTAFAQRGEVYWQCLVGGAAKWKEDATLTLRGDGLTLYAQAETRAREGFTIRFRWDDAQKTFAEILQLAGKVPLPPYISREVSAEDEQRYQTLFAKEEGSVAAPTASLHFSDEVLQSLDQRGIQQARLTLHVGAGTFLPVKSETMEAHAMHQEWVEVDAATIHALIDAKERPVIATGTTALRTLESLYWMGCKLLRNAFAEDLTISQWEPYDSDAHFAASAALAALLEWMHNRKLTKLIGKTGILIAPGYKFRIARGLITNFHQPQSTLLLLVAAFVGDDWRRVYDYALQNDFRFLSYGDGSLLWRGE